ncbi:unnamed protein product [marine sediment metagenome]|uniref:Uncharacterized protein n=1 Tax=marine sediment metagenome TaxID=412755 RepID=X1HRW4_9ZZZZ
MSSDEREVCINCKSWILFDEWPKSGLCARKCGWLLRNKMKFITKRHNPFKHDSQSCHDFERKE